MKRRYYIGNLPYDMTEESLADVLNFQGLQVVNLRVVADKDTGHSKGFGFFETEHEDVLNLMGALDIEGRRARISLAEKQPKPRLVG